MKNKLWHKIPQTLAYLSILPLAISSFVSPAEGETNIFKASNENIFSPPTFPSNQI